MNILARSLTATATLATLLALSATAAASPLTLTLSGRVTAVGGPKVSVLDGLIAAGSPVTVSATYDTDAPDSGSDNPERGDFFFTSGPAGVVVNVNGHLFSTDFADPVNGRLWVFTGNDLWNDYDILGWQGWSSGPTTSPQGVLRTGTSKIEVQLQDWSSPLDFLTGDALPLSPDLSRVSWAFGSVYMGYTRTGDYDYYINYELTAPPPGPPAVPEPGTLALLGLGLAGAIAGRRGRGVAGGRGK